MASLSSFVFRLSSVLLFLAVSSFAAQSSYDLMERANALYRDGKFKQAIMLYRKAESGGVSPRVETGTGKCFRLALLRRSLQ